MPPFKQGLRSQLLATWISQREALNPRGQRHSNPGTPPGTIRTWQEPPFWQRGPGPLPVWQGFRYWQYSPTYFDVQLQKLSPFEDGDDMQVPSCLQGLGEQETKPVVDWTKNPKTVKKPIIQRKSSFFLTLLIHIV